jgi:hypothetical protein
MGMFKAKPGPEGDAGLKVLPCPGGGRLRNALANLSSIGRRLSTRLDRRESPARATGYPYCARSFPALHFIPIINN